jgi:hypothetical protein
MGFFANAQNDRGNLLLCERDFLPASAGKGLRLPTGRQACPLRCGFRMTLKNSSDSYKISIYWSYFKNYFEKLNSCVIFIESRIKLNKKYERIFY